jgi:hypothetical protein
MGHIDEVLTANTIDQCFTAPIQAALTMGKQTLTRYHNKTELSEVYWIAIGVHSLFHLIPVSDFSKVLHPCHKLTYFKNAGWSEKRHKLAYVAVQDTFEMFYKNTRRSEQPNDVCHSFFRLHIICSSLFLATSKIVAFKKCVQRTSLTGRTKAIQSP